MLYMDEITSMRSSPYMHEASASSELWLEEVRRQSQRSKWNKNIPLVEPVTKLDDGDGSLWVIAEKQNYKNSFAGALTSRRTTLVQSTYPRRTV